MKELILETTGPSPVEPIIKELRTLKIASTVHSNTEVVRIAIPLDREIDRTQANAISRKMVDVFEVAFKDADKVTSEAPVGGQVRVIEGDLMKVDTLTYVTASHATENDEDKGPEVPAGINLMSQSSGPVESGDVGPVKRPVGFIQDYQSGAARGLERLAGVVGQVVVRQNDAYWVRSGDSWVATTQGAAIGKVKSEWRPVMAAHGVKCSQRHIEEVFKRSLVPVVDGVLTSPAAADFVDYNGLTYLNRRLAPRLTPSTFGPDGRLIRDFILTNILADDRPWTEIESELADPSAKTPTRWALHWIASLYQRPGVSLSTALWLISVEQGIGKTLFASMLATLIGRQNATKADQAEMAGEWSDWMIGHSLIVADEINVVEKKSFYARQKSWIGSSSISVRRRGVGSWTIPSIANWIFLSNDLTPIKIDAADRRNMMIRSSNDLAGASAMIDRLGPMLDDPKRFRSALAEVGAWLDTIQIDNRLISRAIATDLKDDLIENTRDPVDSFVLEQAELHSWKVGQWLTTDSLMQRYTAWCERTDVFKGCRGQNHLVKELKRLKDRGWVEPSRKNQGRGWTLVNPPNAMAKRPEPPISVDDFFAERKPMKIMGSMLHRDTRIQCTGSPGGIDRSSRIGFGAADHHDRSRGARSNQSDRRTRLGHGRLGQADVIVCTRGDQTTG